MRTILSVVLWGFFLSLEAQVTLVIDSVPDYTPSSDPIYVTGNFNRWHPGDDNYILQQNHRNVPQITLEGYPQGTILEYKFTRGSWETVEKGPDGEDIPNRAFALGNGQTVHHKIHHWADKDEFTPTAAWNVVVMDENFYMPQLERTRRIILYLPPDYHHSLKRYPVVYMHDGQNIFDRSTAYEEEWQVDETLNALAAEGHTVPIVVGIDNSTLLRGDEYLPYINPGYAGGEGFQYLAFIVETLKPYIDAHYRTLPERENTGIMGSSLGGTISWYAALKYQEVFSKAGLFSPAYWANDEQIWGFLADIEKKQDVRFYQSIGDQEGEEYFIPVAQMEDSLNHHGFHDVYTQVVPGGEHVVATWAGDFANAYLWLFNTTAINAEHDHSSLSIYPNPVKDLLKIMAPSPAGRIEITISDMTGRILLKQDYTPEGLNTSQLSSGLYIIRMETNENTHTQRFLKL